MTTYTIEQTDTGIILGTYEADSPEQAWLMCCQDAGYEEAQAMHGKIEVRRTVKIDVDQLGSHWTEEDDIDAFAMCLSGVIGRPVFALHTHGGGDAESITDDDWAEAFDLYYEQHGS